MGGTHTIGPSLMVPVPLDIKVRILSFKHNGILSDTLNPNAIALSNFQVDWVSNCVLVFTWVFLQAVSSTVNSKKDVRSVEMAGFIFSGYGIKLMNLLMTKTEKLLRNERIFTEY